MMQYLVNSTEDGLIKYPMHRHRRYEVMLYLNGQGYLKTDAGDIPFGEGTVIIVPPNVRHCSVSEDGFKNISIEGEFEGLFNFDTVKCFFDSESREGRTLANMIYLNRYGKSAYVSALCSAYACFLAQRVEIESMVHQCVKSTVAEIFEKAFDFDVNLAEILSKSGYSEDYMRSCFKKITGKTPNGFLTEVRMRRACFLMDVYKDRLSLSEIAEKCGYLDYVYFSKKFKSVTGMSPRGYQNQ